MSALPGYSELIKNFEKIRDFVRDFFVFGYRSRGDYGEISARSYDNERRRIRSYLEEYVTENWDGRGKTISIASDTVARSVNPLFTVWETKSFTRNDMFLHFVLLDVLHDACLSAPEIAEAVSNDYLSALPEGVSVDAMTVRNKLTEYAALGLLDAEKRGKSVCYGLARCLVPQSDALSDALLFYQNILPGGFLASGLVKGTPSPFMYRQIFFAQALDDDVALRLLDAIVAERCVTVTQARMGRSLITQAVVPLFIIAGTRTGRRYLAHFSLRRRRYGTMRLDYIREVECGEAAKGFDEIRAEYLRLRENSFSLVHRQQELKNVRMVLRIDEREEAYVLERLCREGRHGVVTRLAEDTFEYAIDVTDTWEMMPWLRTFIGRIVSIEGTEAAVIAQFKRDIEAMARLYAEEADV